MWSRCGIRTVASAALLSATLGACSETYLARRDTISVVSGEAMAANRVTMMIDPWPPASARRTIAYNGEKAATASARYRTGRVIPPQHPMTSSAAYSQSSGSAPSVSGGQGSSGSGGSQIK
jgi:uncharacterized membrane protein YgcG